MDAAERRQAIAQRLAGAEGPVSAAALAQEFAVSRQIIVGDVALLRAGGAAIAATPRGYVLPKESAALTYTVACVHDREGMTRELEIMVDRHSSAHPAVSQPGGLPKGIGGAGRSRLSVQIGGMCLSAGWASTGGERMV